MRASLTQFRLSAHQLNIETGRHHKMALEKRICKCCKTNEIEDEMHFLFNCPLYEMERKDILNMDVKQHKLQESFIEIMENNEKANLLALAKFIHCCFEKRKRFIVSD